MTGVGYAGSRTGRQACCRRGVRVVERGRTGGACKRQEPGHLHPDRDQPADIIATWRDALAPGSYLVICHACRDEQPSLATSFETVYNNRVTAQLNMRSRDEITSLCDGFTLLEPGLVWIP